MHTNSTVLQRVLKETAYSEGFGDTDFSFALTTKPDLAETWVVVYIKDSKHNLTDIGRAIMPDTILKDLESEVDVFAELFRMILRTHKNKVEMNEVREELFRSAAEMRIRQEFPSTDPSLGSLNYLIEKQKLADMAVAENSSTAQYQNAELQALKESFRDRERRGIMRDPLPIRDRSLPRGSTLNNYNEYLNMDAIRESVREGSRFRDIPEAVERTNIRRANRLLPPTPPNRPTAAQVATAMVEVAKTFNIAAMFDDDTRKIEVDKGE